MNKTPPTDDVGTIDSVDPAEAVVLGVAIHAAQLFLKTGALTVPTQVKERGGGNPSAAPATPCGISGKSLQTTVANNCCKQLLQTSIANKYCKQLTSITNNYYNYYNYYHNYYHNYYNQLIQPTITTNYFS